MLPSPRSHDTAALASALCFKRAPRAGAKPNQGLIENWWRQGMMGAANAHYECVKAFSETDFTEGLKTVTVPTLLAHGTDDQIVPIADSALLGIKLLKRGTLKTYEGLPHGMRVVNAY
jgi:non-heme chloroperoxidase